MTKQAKAPAFTVRGQVINGNRIAGFAKRFNSMDDTLTLWANAAALQASGTNRNRNWLESLFNAQPLRLTNGQLSKLGKQVLAYVTAHYPHVTFDTESQSVKLKKYNPNSPYNDYFAAPGVTLEQAAEQPDQYVVIKDKVLTKHGDFALTFAEFNSLEKPETEEKPDAGVTAKAFAKQLEKVATAVQGQRFVGTDEEKADALAKLKALFLLLDSAHSATEEDKAQDGEKQVDVILAGQLLQSGQKGKAVRAGDKVAA